MYSTVQRLEDLLTEERPRGYGFFEKDTYRYATSDIEQAAFLVASGIPDEGTIVHEFESSRGTRKKVFFVFNQDKSPEVHERIKHMLREYSTGLGQKIRTIESESARLKKRVNDAIDMEPRRT